MLWIQLQGGLGNQMFQIMTTIACGIRQDRSYRFLESIQSGITHRSSYWETLFKTLRPYVIPPHDIPIDYQTYHETGFHYQEIPSNATCILLSGYFQSFHYFQEEWKHIRTLLSIDQRQKEIIQKYPMEYNQYISMHFRRGDYQYLQEYHPCLSIEYYQNAIHFLCEHQTLTRILYFCEKEDWCQVWKMIEILSLQFPQLQFISVSEDIQDWEQLLLMSSCRHHILANSTFSWWGAYLNHEKIDKIICYPTKWFGPALSHYDTKDLFPPEWHGIQVE